MNFTKRSLGALAGQRRHFGLGTLAYEL